MSLLLEEIKREGDVLRGEPRTVVEFGFRPDEKSVVQAVGRAAHLRGGKAVHRVGLIARAHHQGGEGELHALRRIAPEDIAVEGIEGEKILVELPRRPNLRESAALRRPRVDVTEMSKVRRVSEIAER